MGEGTSQQVRRALPPLIFDLSKWAQERVVRGSRRIGIEVSAGAPENSAAVLDRYVSFEEWSTRAFMPRPFSDDERAGKGRHIGQDFDRC